MAGCHPKLGVACSVLKLFEDSESSCRTEEGVPQIRPKRSIHGVAILPQTTHLLGCAGLGKGNQRLSLSFPHLSFGF